MAVPAKSSLFDSLTVEIRPATPRDLPGIIEAWDELSALHATLDSAFERSERWQEEYRHFVRSLIGREDARRRPLAREPSHYAECSVSCTVWAGCWTPFTHSSSTATGSNLRYACSIGMRPSWQTLLA